MHLHGVFAPDALFEVDLEPHQIVDYMVDQVAPTFSLGPHDENRVLIDQLGAGTQSVLAMALTQLSLSQAEHQLLLLEEPEAFLHPSAQRTLAWQLLQKASTQLIATTHSPLVLAEADPSSVVVLREHTVHPASAVSALQEAKDRYQLSTWVAGCMFDRSLLLVEGPGDLAFFETLRRRLADFIPVSVLSRMRVAAVGGKTSFGPWLNLLRRFHDAHSGSMAYSILVCADSADAGAAVMRAFRDASATLPQDLQQHIRAITSTAAAAASVGAGSQPLTNDSPDGGDSADAGGQTAGNAQLIAERTRSVNRAAGASGVGVHFTPVDLEYAATVRLSDYRAREFAGAIDEDAVNAADLASRLGSKGGDGPASSAPGAKAPHVRAALARFLDWDEIDQDLKDLLWRWIEPATNAAGQPRPVQLT